MSFQISPKKPHTHTRTQARTHTHTHTRTRKHTHTRTQAHTHARAHTHTHTQWAQFSSNLGPPNHTLYHKATQDPKGMLRQVKCLAHGLSSGKNLLEDPVRLEPGTSRLRVTHFTTEPCRTPVGVLTLSQTSPGFYVSALQVF